MKAVVVSKAGAPFEITHDLERPAPGARQILVKNCYTAINPVDTFQQQTGLLVEHWPAVLGADAGGIVVAVGAGVTKFKEGDKVFGCTKLGTQGYSAFEEYYLMDELLAFLKPENMPLKQAASMGAGILTALLGLVSGFGLHLPAQGENPSHDEWIMILGGSGNVGQFAVQTAKLCGYHVLATCSSSNESGVKHNGADATLDYKLDLETQLKHVKSITGGNLIAVYDTSAQAAAAGLQFLDKASTAEKRAFATTGDWAPLDLPKNVTSSTRVLLGPIGRGTELDKEIAGFVPYVERYLVEGKLRPAEVKVVEGGLEAVPEAVEMAGRNPGKKVVVHVADP